MVIVINGTITSDIDGITVTDDGNGNLTISGDITVTDDGSGNVAIAQEVTDFSVTINRADGEIDWSKGFSASYYMTIVDPASWRDLERVEITGGTISRTGSGLRQSADVECTDFDPEREQWVRVYLDVAQAGDVAHVALFTGLSSVPERAINGNRTRYPLTCYSVLKPAEDVLLQRGWFAPSGVNGAELVADLLSVTPAPVTVEVNAPSLAQSIIAENGENRLTMTNKILAAINWRLRIEGDGSITICPQASELSGTFGLDNDVIEPKLTRRADWFSCPNVFRAISGSMTAVVRDDSEDSFLSTVSRGREIWMEEKCDLNSGESLEQYAQRRLQEEQAVAYSVQYARRFDPKILVGDLVRLHYPAQNLMNTYVVTRQSIDLSYGARTSEEVQM